MGATRVMMSLAVVGIAAGAYLAVATVPSFAPYRDRRASAPVIIDAPIAGDKSGGYVQDQQPSTGDYGLAQPEPSEDEGFGVRPGEEAGTIVLQLPNWARDTTRWYGLGERAWQEWRSWTDSDDADDRGFESRAPSYAERRGRGPERYGSGQGIERRGDRYYEDEPDDGPRYSPRYAPRNGWSRGESDGDEGWSGAPGYFSEPMPQEAPPQGYAPRQRFRPEQSRPGAGVDEPGADAAARAAERARNAARDVRDAERQPD